MVAHHTIRIILLLSQWLLCKVRGPTQPCFSFAHQSIQLSVLVLKELPAFDFFFLPSKKAQMLLMNKQQTFLNDATLSCLLHMTSESFAPAAKQASPCLSCWKTLVQSHNYIVLASCCQRDDKNIFLETTR